MDEPILTITHKGGAPLVMVGNAKVNRMWVGRDGISHRLSYELDRAGNITNFNSPVGCTEACIDLASF